MRCRKNGNAVSPRCGAAFLTAMLSVLWLLMPFSGAFASQKVENLQVTVHPANDRYLCLSFDFTANGSRYAAFISGIRSEEDPSLWANALALKIADSFGRGETLRIANKSTGKAGEYILPAIDLMDAEKQNLFSPPECETGEAPEIMSDTELCWAASASNALELSGWGRAVTAQNPGKVDLKNEDDLFAYFANSYMDYGNRSIEGEKWFLNGIHYEEEVDRETGEVLFGGFSWLGAQLWEKGSGGLMKDLCAASVVSQDYDIACSGVRHHVTIKGLNQAADDLEKGYGISMGIEFVNMLGGHDLCMTGVIRSLTLNGPGDVMAVFLADSDNDAATYDYDDQEAEKKAGPREKRVNSFEMYPITVKNVADSDLVTVDGFWMHPETLSMISDISSIKPWSNSFPKENLGTRDVYASPDLVSTEIVLGVNYFRQDEATVGIPLRICADISNQSYVRLTEEPSATVTIRYLIVKDGVLCDTVTKDVKLEGKRLLPLSRGRDGSEILYTFTEPGVYDIGLEILNAFDSKGSIHEAYVMNNTLKYARVTVEPLPPPPATGDAGPIAAAASLLMCSAAALYFCLKRKSC